MLYVPMKFTDVADETELGILLEDPDWVAEQKMDGTRVTAFIRSNGVQFNSGAGPLKHTAALQWAPDLIEPLSRMRTHDEDLIILEGELMIHTGEYRLFDLVTSYHEEDGLRIGPHHFWSIRRAGLELMHLAANLPADGPVSLVRTAVGTRDKKHLLEQCEAAGAEGVIFKHVRGTYEMGQRVSTVRKQKFVKTADVIVTSYERARNEAGRETGSARLAVYGPGEALISVGACSLIGKPEVRVGDVIEVAYLYWTGTSLYQPRMIRVREDKEPEECTIEQFPRYSREAV